jgi:hypothetical protein
MKKKISDLMIKKYATHQYSLPEHNPTADFDWIRNESGLPWLKLNIQIPHKQILKEIEAVQELLVDHRDDYGEHNGWKSFCICGKSFDATREDEFYNDNRPYIWTPEAKQHMPNTVKYFSEYWPGNTFFRVRIMLLEPNGYITIHKDTDTSKLCPINIAITQPNDCLFVMEKYGTVPFSPGNAYLLDISNNHAVVNNSDQPRWHIIVHQKFDDKELKSLVVNSYNLLYNNLL